MNREGQGTSEQKPRPPASTRWAEPGAVEATGPVPPFVPRSRPAAEQPTAERHAAEQPTVESEWDPASEWEPESDQPVDVADTDDAVGMADDAVADTDDAAADTAEVAHDTSEAVAETPDPPPMLEYDISGPFEPLPRDQGGWVPEDEQPAEDVVYEPTDDWGDPVDAEEDAMVPVSELPTPSEAAGAQTGSPDLEAEAVVGDSSEEAPDSQSDTDTLDAAVREEAGFDEGPPDLAAELADRLDVLAARLREEGADAAREEMESFDRFTALVAGLVSGFLAGHGR